MQDNIRALAGFLWRGLEQVDRDIAERGEANRINPVAAIDEIIASPRPPSRVALAQDGPSGSKPVRGACSR